MDMSEVQCIKCELCDIRLSSTVASVPLPYYCRSFSRYSRPLSTATTPPFLSSIQQQHSLSRQMKGNATRRRSLASSLRAGARNLPVRRRRFQKDKTGKAGGRRMHETLISPSPSCRHRAQGGPAGRPAGPPAAMPGSPKVFFASSASHRSGLLRRLLSTPAFSAVCLLFGLAGFLAAALALSCSPSVTHNRCPDSSRPLSVSIAWDRSPGDGSAELPASLATGSCSHHKVMAFVGIFTGFGSIGRRRALRRTWLPADRQGLLRSVAGITSC
jgi:hypothetical protein